MPVDTSPKTLLRRSGRAVVIGLALAACAFLCLFVPELVFTFSRAGLTDIPGLLILTAAGAFFYALGFNLVFFLARLSAALLTHLRWFWHSVMPGVVLFLLLQPILPFLGADSTAGMGGVLLIIGLIIVSMLLSLVVLFYFPTFRGVNASFLFYAALVTRLLFLPLPAPDSPPGLGLYLLRLVITTGGLYAVLHIRFRQHISPEIEPFAVADHLLYRGAILTPLFLIIFLIQGLAAAGDADSRFAAPDLALLPTGLIVLFVIHWVLTVLWINHDVGQAAPAAKPEIPRIAYGVAGGVCAALLFMPVFFPNPRLATAVRHSGIFSHEVLLAVGAFMDADGDGNSAWPGGDPDDTNACVRVDRKCRSAEKTTLVAPPVSKFEYRPARFDDAPRESDRPGATKVIILLTVSNAPLESLGDWRELNSELRKERSHRKQKSAAGSDDAPKAEKVRKRRTKKRKLARKGDDAKTLSSNISPAPTTKRRRRARAAAVFLPAHAPEHALRALFAQSDGPSARSGEAGRSIIQNLAQNGYRTICGGSAGDDTYLEVRRGARLDLGCQVHVPIPQARPGEAPSLSLTVKAMRRNFKNYRERRTFVWIHHQYSDANRTPEILRAARARELRSLAAGLARDGELVVLLMPADHPIGEAWLVSRRRVDLADAFVSPARLLAELGGFKDDASDAPVAGPGVLELRRDFSLVARLVGFPNYVTYRLVPDTGGAAGDRVEYFDGLTGARWTPEAPAITRKHAMK